MEENTQISNPMANNPKRSQFLKVLCILSFCMCGFTFMSGLAGLYFSSPDVMQKNIEQVRVINPEAADQMENNMILMESNAYAKIAPYLGLLYTLLSFLGVMLMWQNNKNGLYIYSFSEILPYTGFIFMGKNSLSMIGGGVSSSLGMAAIVISIAIDVVFVALYIKALSQPTQTAHAD